MKIFNVELKETRLRAVSIKAKDKNDAEQRAVDAWRNCEITLSGLDELDNVEIEAKALDDGTDDDGSVSCCFEADTVAGGYGSE